MLPGTSACRTGAAAAVAVAAALAAAVVPAAALVANSNTQFAVSGMLCPEKQQWQAHVVKHGPCSEKPGALVLERRHHRAFHEPPASRGLPALKSEPQGPGARNRLEVSASSLSSTWSCTRVSLHLLQRILPPFFHASKERP